MPAPDPERFQARFHRRWMHLNDPHVRALAWLLDAPDLLDPQAPQWQGRVATLGGIDRKTEDWLTALDSAPDLLYAYLGAQPFTRLGRYAEKLMAFYFEHQGILIAHGMQVRADKNGTIGEFDFLLRRGNEMVHWEFASKFYLLESSGAAGGENAADDFVGPNLADTLGQKVRKIMERQLSLSQHPAARSLLTEPVAAAQALIKGWLFYYGQTPAAGSLGVSNLHCRGFWCTLGELGDIGAERYMALPRLKWLAPAKTVEEDCLSRADMQRNLEVRFETDSMPVMIALLEPRAEYLVEVDRGFIVPNDWPSRAGARVTHMVRPS